MRPKLLGEEPVHALELKDMLCPYPPEEMELWPVGKAVDNVRNNGAELLERVAVDPEEFGQDGRSTWDDLGEVSRGFDHVSCHLTSTRILRTMVLPSHRLTLLRRGIEWRLTRLL